MPRNRTPLPHLNTTLTQVFGLINPLPSFGFGGTEGSASVTREETLAPVLDTVTAFRDAGAYRRAHVSMCNVSCVLV